MSLATKLFDLLGSRRKKTIPYWLEISTEAPKCVYFFGPFESPLEAKASQAGYVEDVMAESALGISVKLKQCPQPPELTIYEPDIFD